MKIRKNDLPLKVDTKTLNEGPLGLSSNEGLDEPSHFIVVDGKFLVSEINTHSMRPRVLLETQINDVLSEKQLGCSECSIKPILNKDAYKKLEKAQDVGYIDLKVASEYSSALIGEEPSIYAAFFPAATFGTATIRVKLTSRRKKDLREKFTESVTAIIKKLMDRSDVTDKVYSAKLSAKFSKGGQTEIIDLIEEYLSFSTKVTSLDTTTKAVDPIDMYNKLLSGYSEHKAELSRFTKESEK